MHTEVLQLGLIGKNLIKIAEAFAVTLILVVFLKNSSIWPAKCMLEDKEQIDSDH